MKNLLTYLIILIVAAGCGEQKTDNNSATIKNPVETKFDVPKDYIGAYISSDYILELKLHGSTKNAQEKALLSTAQIYQQDENTIISTAWSFHEGGGTDLIKMTSSSEAIVIGELSNDTVFNIDFSKDGEIIIFDNNNSYKLKKFNPDPKNINHREIVNSSVLSGKFFINNNEIEFLPNGEILGLDSIVGYSFHEDYFDAGMQLDMIYLKYKNDSIDRTFGYHLNEAELQIFKLNCIEKDEEYDYCLVRSKGDVIFNLKREELK